MKSDKALKKAERLYARYIKLWFKYERAEKKIDVSPASWGRFMSARAKCFAAESDYAKAYKKYSQVYNK